MRYSNDLIYSYVFIKKFNTEFAIIAVYVDDLNIIKTPKEVQKAVTYLKEEFKMKDLGKTKYYLNLQIEYMSSEIFIHQSAYTKKILKHFYMDIAHPLSSPMVVRSLDLKNFPLRPKEEEKKLFGPEAPYLSAIGALMYLANYTRFDIAFAVNLLAIFSSASTRRHWNGIKHIMCYLQGTVDMGLLYPYNSEC